MDLLKLALDARVPYIHAVTDDLLNVKVILDYLVSPQGLEACLPMAEVGNVKEGAVYIAAPHIEPTTALFAKMKAAGASLVFVNTKPSVLHLQTGTMLPPQELVLREVSNFVDGDTKVVDEVMPAFGGMTLKDTYDLLLMTQERDGKITARGVNKTRQSYVAKLKGIQQIDSDQDFYLPPAELQEWIDSNLPLFESPVHPSLTPRGLLLDGPPGTGKTEAGKYLASLLKVPLYHLDVTSMKGKYVGDSEGALNAALTQIDQAAPCVVLFDEVEKIFHGGQGGDGNVTSGMLSQILWWLQDHKTRVLTVMTTNDKGKLPPELHRPGRLDKCLFFAGLTSEAQVVGMADGVLSSLEESGAFPALTDAERGLFRKRSKSMAEAEIAAGAVPQARVAEFVRTFVKGVLVSRLG